MKVKNYSSYLLLLLLAMIWGSSFILIKKGLGYMEATHLGALRVGLTGVLLAPFALRKLKKYNKEELFYLAISGLCGSMGPAVLFALAETQIDSSLAGVLNSMTPIFTLIIGIIVFSLDVNKNKVLGIILGLAGAFMLILTQNGGEIGLENAEYAIFAVIAALLYGVNINIIKKKLSHLPSLDITSVSFTLLLLPVLMYLYGTGFVDQIYNEPNTIIGIGYVSVLALVGTGLAYLLFNKLIKDSGPVFASSVTYLIPIFAIFWGVLDGELLDLTAFIWIIFIIAGIILINRPSVKPSMAKID